MPPLETCNELDSSLQARQSSWKNVSRRLYIRQGHIAYSGRDVKVQGGTKRLHPICWVLWVHGQITGQQALVWGTKQTWTPVGSRYAIPIVKDLSYTTHTGCITPNHFLIRLPGEPEYVRFEFEVGNLAPTPRELKPINVMLAENEIEERLSSKPFQDRHAAVRAAVEFLRSKGCDASSEYGEDGVTYTIHVHVDRY